MVPKVNHDRRRFLRSAAMTFAAAHLGLWRGADARASERRELAAFDRATTWLNSAALTSESLHGKVVLVDFWTYTCINWLRTLPYLRAWAHAYTGQLVVIGVHTPEFPFEHDIENVRRAARQLRVEYPIAIDNDYAIWRAFNNNYWPALYAFDARGRLRHHQFGEGDYDRAEGIVRRLLADAGATLPGPESPPIEASAAEAPADWDNLRSSESYVGYQRAENFASPGGAARDRSRQYTLPPRLALNQWALAGDWTIGGQATVLNGRSGRIAMRFHARDVHLVMGPSRQGGSIPFRVSIDGQPPRAGHGLDVDADGNGMVIEPRLYQLIRHPRPIVDRQLEIEFPDPGLEVFSFTFG
jgi:thiol-disulfide isomerase/thioredoxin